METRVSSSGKEVIISDNQPAVLIGERINPTGKKELAEALKTVTLRLSAKKRSLKHRLVLILLMLMWVCLVHEVALSSKVVQAVMGNRRYTIVYR